MEQHPQPACGPCLVVEGLCKHFGGLRAVDEVSLTVARGERRAIIGPNGAGKTTFFHLLSGELPATSGRVVLFGRDVTRLPSHRRAGLGLGRTFQVTNLFSRLTVLENVLLAVQGLRLVKYQMHQPILRRHDLRDRAQGLIERVGLWDRREWPITSLSYGEQRQLELVLALAGEPTLLLLDEPTAGLSPAETQILTSIIRSLDPTITVLLIEHDMDVAFEVTERITLLHLGRVLADGTKAEIRRNPEVQSIYLGAGTPA
jgi:branched-chain amino acid transport system ATP-binding protein